jgi:DNA-binding MarR family transcriptional regulator
MDNPRRTPGANALTGLVMHTFRLNGQFLAAAETMARPVGLTAAWWQVLGGIESGPLPVSGIARKMGLARQSVQRIADLLVAKGLAQYRPNPAHRRAKLLDLTDTGRAAMSRLARIQPEWANRIAAEFDPEDLASALAVLDRLVAIMAKDLTDE